MKTTASLYMQLYVDCPFCGETTNLLEQDPNGEIQGDLISSNWESIEGDEYFCCGCKEYFEVASITLGV